MAEILQVTFSRSLNATVCSNFTEINQIHKSHNASIRYPPCTSHTKEMCTFPFWMVHCGFWDRFIVGFVNNFHWNKPNSQISQCTNPISHNAPFRTEMCTFQFWMVYCGIWDRCNVGFVNLVFCYGPINILRKLNQRPEPKRCISWPTRHFVVCSTGNGSS